MLILCDTTARRVIGLREVVLLQPRKRRFHRCFAEAHHWFAIAQLVAGVYNRVQGKRVHVWREGGFFSEHAEYARLEWGKIEFDANSEPIDNVVVAPDWTIEILSPEQSANRVTGNILHCLTHGCQLGWLIDPDDRSILVFRSQHQPELLISDNILPVLAGVELTLTVTQVFSWLQMGGS